MPDLTTKLHNLKERIRSYRRVIVAYSGGVDSTFLLKVALDSLGPDKVLAAIGRSASLSGTEFDTAVKIAQELRADLEVVFPQEMSSPDYKANPPNRCYYCKTHLYQVLNDMARKRDYDVVLSGNNADDLDDFRPGHQAGSEMGVASPLQEAQLTKDDIRRLSQQMNLPTWDKPAQPCLASRIAYNLEITPQRLKQVEDGEAFLRQLGLVTLRVRHHDNLVRIEVPSDKIMEMAEPDTRKKIVTFFKQLGFKYVSLDLQGFRSGSANEVL